MGKRVSVNYNWNTYLNDKAIIDFEEKNFINANSLKLEHYYVASFIAQVYMRPDSYSKLKTKNIQGHKYTYMSTHFILRNLKLLKIQERSLKRILKNLDDSNFIDRIVLNKNQRYIKPNENFIKCYSYSMHQDIDKNRVGELVSKIGRVFGKSKNKSIFLFIRTLSNFNHFEEQFNSYVSYKEYTNEHFHSYEKFILIWDEYDWSLLLEKREMQEHMEQVSKYL